MNANHDGARQADGWPEEDRPIFMDAGYGRVDTREPGSRGRRLSDGAIVPSDAEPAAFAQAWAEILDEEPEDARRWEYAVQEPDELGDEGLVALPLPEALERVRLQRGARLQRRPVGDWHVVETPFPRRMRIGWGELEASKEEWHTALNEFPPNYRGVISRLGGVDHAPEEWTEYARRAAAAGFSPAEYRMLATAHFAWRARDDAHGSNRRPIPSLAVIEAWAPFPQAVQEGRSLLEALWAVARGMK